MTFTPFAFYYYYYYYYYYCKCGADYVKRSGSVIIPCRPNSEGSVKMESDLSSETVTWTDSVGRELAEGRLKVDAERRLVLKGVRDADVGTYVCTVSKVTSSDKVKIMRHVVRLNGITAAVLSLDDDDDDDDVIVVVIVL